MAKKIQLTFKNHLDETNIDHLEVWWKFGANGIYQQLNGDIAFVSGAGTYLIEDLSANVTEGVVLYYQARAYNILGDYDSTTISIQVSVSEIFDTTEIFATTEIFE